MVKIHQTMLISVKIWCRVFLLLASITNRKRLFQATKLQPLLLRDKLMNKYDFNCCKLKFCFPTRNRNIDAKKCEVNYLETKLHTLSSEFIWCSSKSLAEMAFVCKKIFMLPSTSVLFFLPQIVIQSYNSLLLFLHYPGLNFSRNVCAVFDLAFACLTSNTSFASSVEIRKLLTCWSC